MPDRVIRGELIESEAWLTLKDNADRAAWISCVLTVDNFGDMPAGPHRLCRLWRPYGIDSAQKAAQTFGNLIEVDLVRRYEVDKKPYLHIPRFRQHLRWVGHAYPLSPWATNEEKQAFAKKYPAEHKPSPAFLCVPQAEVDLEVEVELDKSNSTPPSPAAPDVAVAIEKPKVKPAVKGSRMEPDAQCPDEWIYWATQVYRITPQKAVLLFVEFRDYWSDIPGQRGLKIRWFGTFKNRLRALADKGAL